MTYDLEITKREDIEAGRRALTSLYKAKRELEHARSLGIWDLFNLGIMNNILKRDRMKRAESYMHQAKDELNSFCMKFMDMDPSGALHIETQDLLSLTDLFFDGIPVDLTVQGRIIKAEEQVEETIRRIESILRREGVKPEDFIIKKKYSFGPEDWNPGLGITLMAIIVFLMIVWK